MDETSSRKGIKDEKEYALYMFDQPRCRTVCLTDPFNDQLVKDERAQIFYSIRS